MQRSKLEADMTFEQALKTWTAARKAGDRETMRQCREELRKMGFCPADVAELIGRECDEHV